MRWAGRGYCIGKGNKLNGNWRGQLGGLASRIAKKRSNARENI